MPPVRGKGQGTKRVKAKRPIGKGPARGKGTGHRGCKSTFGSKKIETAPLSVLLSHEPLERAMSMETRSGIRERGTNRSFKRSDGAWKASFVLKASLWRCNTVDF